MAPTLKLPPTRLGRSQRAFADQFALDQIDSHTFLSTTGAAGSFKVPFKGQQRIRSYGGHVYAQAAWAAAQTVASGFVLHSISGYFVSPGWADVPFVYRVKVLKDGKGYMMRTVEATQMDTEGVCFTCTCSFKTKEKSQFGVLDIQDPVYPEEKYKEFLRGQKPQDVGELVFDGEISFRKNKQRGYTNSFPTTKLGILPMDEYNEPRHPLERRQLYYYAVPGDMPSIDVAPNLHICNHLYCADRSAVMLIAEHFGLTQNVKTFASLSTTVIFHYGAEELAMLDKAGNERWFCQEVFTERYGDGRGLHRSRIWDDQGRHVATTVQDAQVKLNFENKEQFDRVKAGTETKAKI